MSYQIEFKAEAIAGLEVLNSTIQERLLRKIRWLCENFDDLTPQALSADLSGLFKLRAGNYRVIYSFDTEALLITIHRIGHRRDIYN
jgi:mRNA interferase RelE/StbE